MTRNNVRRSSFARIFGASVLLTLGLAFVTMSAREQLRPRLAQGDDCLPIAGNGQSCTGICIDLTCSLGSCAEYSAIAAMLKERQSEIAPIVAVCRGQIVPPCGRCRELIRQVNPANARTRIIVAAGHVTTLGELLPFSTYKVDAELTRCNTSCRSFTC